MLTPHTPYIQVLTFVKLTKTIELARFVLVLKLIMDKNRIEGLSDGVFAIVMTLIVLEIHIPKLPLDASNTEIWTELAHLLPVFGSFVLSFAVLVTYWVSHHFMITTFAKTVDRSLAYLNILFLLVIALIPFSASLLGLYNQNQLAVVWYGSHVLIIAGVLFLMRRHIVNTPKIEVNDFSDLDRRYSNIRIWLPIVMTVLGILISFISTVAAVLCFVLPLFISIIPGSVAYLDRLFMRFISR